MIVDAGGITPYEEIENSIGSWPLVTWPFPQIFYGHDLTYVITDDAIYDYDDTENTIASVPSGGTRWDVVDYFGYLIFCNSNYCLIRDAKSGMISSFTPNDSFPTFRTACDFRGQVFIGNITSDWNGCGANHVAWSRIGNADFAPSKANEANFTRMPFNGEVLKVKHLSDGVVCYGSDGVMLLMPLPNSPHVGRKHILNNGILSRHAVAGDDEVHLFVDRNYRLWKMARDMVPKRIGYKEFLEPLGVDLCVTYDNVLKRFYISNGVKSYCVTAFAMTEVFQSPTSVKNGFGFVYSTGDRRAFIETSEFDFGLPGLKSIETVSVSSSHSPLVGSRSFDAGGNLVMVRSDVTGSGFPRNTGSLVSVLAVFDDFRKADIQSLFVEGKHIDKRFTRGSEYDKKT
jgi:hypothetical protein